MTAATQSELAADVHVPQKKRTGNVRAFDTTVDVWEDRGRPVQHDDAEMRMVMRAAVARLHTRGFHMERDPKTLREFPTLADCHWYGRKGDLEVKVECWGRTLSVQFFQSLNVENPNGGRYDFSKFARMPRPMQLACAVEMAAVMRKLLTFGYALGDRDHRWRASDYDTTRLAYSLFRIADGRCEAEESPLEHFNRRWDPKRFKRDEHGWPRPDEHSYHPAIDRDGKPLRSGDVKFLRLRSPKSGYTKGQLYRVTAFPGVNGQWHPVSNGVLIAYDAQADDFFDCDEPAREPRRVVTGQIKRLEAELEKATKAKTWPRVAVLAGLLARMEPRS